MISYWGKTFKNMSDLLDFLDPPKPKEPPVRLQESQASTPPVTVAPEEPTPTKKEKVFCCECKYLDKVKDDYVCSAPFNLVDTWFKEGGKFKSQPADINRHNGCPSFEPRKQFQTPTK